MIDPAARALVADLRARFGQRLAVYVGVQTLAALVEGVGILLLIPLLAAVSGDAPEWMPRLSIETALLLFLAAMVVRAFLMLVRTRLQAGLTRDYSADLAGDLADRLAMMGWPAASDIGQARMQQYWSSDVPRSAIAVNLLLMMAVSALLLLVQGGIAIVLSPPMALAAAVLLLLSALTSAVWVRRSSRQGIHVMDTIGDTQDLGFRFHASLKSALAEGREGAFARRYRERAMAEQQALYSVDLAEAKAGVANQLAAALGLAAILYVGLEMVTLDPAMLIVLLVLFARMMGPARSLLSQFQRFLAFAPSFGPVAALLAARRGHERPPQPGDIKRMSWRILSFDDLRLVSRGDPVGPLVGRVGRGRWLGLSGPSGAGKSLLVDTLVGLVEPVGGTIRLDDAAFAPTRASGWPREIAYLGQDGGINGATLRALIDAPDGMPEARLHELLGAMGAADLAARIGSLDAPVGDRAARISGGERQRLALVRAILRAPSLLVLDEATAALDLDAEAAVIAEVRRRLPDAAVILVTHRPQTLGLVDDRLDIACPG